MKFFLLSILILSALKTLCWGEESSLGSPSGAATDNAARYTVNSSPVLSKERNISLDFDDVSMILQAEKLGKFNCIINNNCLILAL